MSKITSTGTNALTALISLIKTALGGKVDKVDGMGLSSSDFTGGEKTKLAGIAEGANKTVIVDSLTSADAASALSANQGKVLDEKIAAINTSLDGKGSGDMAKATYDADGDGVVDNAAQLGGQAPGYYAAAADVPTKVSQLTNDSAFQTADEVAAAISARVSSTYKAGGTVRRETGLPPADAEHLGMVYNIIYEFTTTASFLEGTGKNYPAGTNVAVVLTEAHPRVNVNSRTLADENGKALTLTENGTVYYIRYLDNAASSEDNGYYKTPHPNGSFTDVDFENAKLDPAQPEIAALIERGTVPAGITTTCCPASWT